MRLEEEGGQGASTTAAVSAWRLTKAVKIARCSTGWHTSPLASG